MMKQGKRIWDSGDGFTLVEMIVVVVIIGVLLSVMVPGMTRYIDKAKEKQLEVNARAVYLAYQMELAEVWAEQGTADPASAKAEVDALFTSEYIEDLIGVESDAAFSVSGVVLDANGAVLEFIYSEAGRSVRYSNGSWEMMR